MAVPLPDIQHRGPWTTDDLEAMGETKTRYELTDGALTVSPSPASPHQSVAAYLTFRLAEMAPDGFAVTQDVDVYFSKFTTRRPDVLVVQVDAGRNKRFVPEEVLLAVEIESPGSHVEDRVTKPAIYSRHAIASFWRIELDPITVVTHRLSGAGQYEETGRFIDRIIADAPWPIDLPIEALTPRWLR